MYTVLICALATDGPKIKLMAQLRDLPIIPPKDTELQFVALGGLTAIVHKVKLTLGDSRVPKVFVSWLSQDAVDAEFLRKAGWSESFDTV